MYNIVIFNIWLYNLDPGVSAIHINLVNQEFGYVSKFGLMLDPPKMDRIYSFPSSWDAHFGIAPGRMAPHGDVLPGARRLGPCSGPTLNYEDLGSGHVP